jgi:hypothetical protein
MLIRNKIAEQWELSDLFTPRQAYEFVVNDLKAQLPPNNFLCAQPEFECVYCA